MTDHMTEQQWLASHDIEKMVECLITRCFPDAEPCNWKNGERRKRMFIQACMRRIWTFLPEEYKTLFELWETSQDASDEAVQTAFEVADGVKWEHSNLLFAVGYDDIGSACGIAARLEGDDASASQATLLRCVFGNPFRPLTMPSLLNDSVVKIAQAIYEQRSFDRMPVLADALEECGVAAELVTHCRGPGPHVRGCWVVDLILGKS